MNRDPYEVLGVPRTASDDEIKAAYRTLAKKYHPDLNNGAADAERKMKEVNEAYSILIKHKGDPGYSQSYGGNSQGSQGGYGSYGGYGGYGGYGSRGGSSTGGSQSGDFGGFGFDPFGFGDFFGGNQRQRTTYTQTTYTEFDPELKHVEDAVIDQSYERAIQLLGAIRDHRAAWYYWSARANMGLGNRIAALNDARTAVQMSPDEEAFRELLATLNASGSGYRQYGSSRGFGQSFCQSPLLSVCIPYILCNFCCCGSRYGACC